MKKITSSCCRALWQMHMAAVALGLVALSVLLLSAAGIYALLLPG